MLRRDEKEGLAEFAIEGRLGGMCFGLDVVREVGLQCDGCARSVGVVMIISVGIIIIIVILTYVMACLMIWLCTIRLW